jgi:hypothetical protein
MALGMIQADAAVARRLVATIKEVAWQVVSAA